MLIWVGQMESQGSIEEESNRIRVTAGDMMTDFKTLTSRTVDKLSCILIYQICDNLLEQQEDTHIHFSGTHS